MTKREPSAVDSSLDGRCEGEEADEAVVGARLARARWTRQMYNAYTGGPERYHFDRSGLRTQRGRSESTVAWSAYDRYRVEKRTLQLIYPNGAIVLIPKRAFDDASWVVLRRLLTENLERAPRR